MQITAKVNFGKDLGQNLGTVFEARDSDGRVFLARGSWGFSIRTSAWTAGRYSFSFVTMEER